MEIEQQTESQHIDDETVLRRVMAGEKEAYELLMRKYNQRLFRIVHSYIVDEDEIEDVIQETYIKAYEQLPRFEGRSRFSTWLVRIAINEALGRLRERKRLRSMTPDSSDAHGAAEELLIKSQDNETPLGTVMNTELKHILEEAVDRLPEKYKLVFLMREIEGMSVGETSESLAITEMNVRVRLNRAKEMLRKTISGFYRREEIFHFDLVRCDRIVHNVLQRLEAI